MSNVVIHGLPQWALDILERRSAAEQLSLENYLRQLLINAARNPNVGIEPQGSQNRLTGFGDAEE
ncbi:hypothetical protein [Salininema proteolyticum]|uniref:CopG-like ribbon-helix-helix domain-containing protein n=1 Tax=Salininema proteolyticum TaxID=1607685 RepID=A0ABV8TSW1_9ACTN